MKLVIQIHTSNMAFVEKTVDLSPVEVKRSVLGARTFLRDQAYTAADAVIEEVLKDPEVWW